MYTQEIRLITNLAKDKESLYEEFSMLLANYYNNGQVQDDTDNLHIDSDSIRCFPLTIAKDALKKKHNTPLINDRIKKVENLSKSKLQFNVLGKSPIYDAKACKCKKSDFYLLFTTFNNIGSPITCGNCELDVPLYKLPLYDDYGYRDILSWESNYQACDTLNMNCEVGEMWAMKQMWRLDSTLSQQGIGICEKLTELTNIPTYYYLYNYRRISRKKDLKRKCPSCNGDWLINNDINTLYNFKCDKCRLISSLSSNHL